MGRFCVLKVASSLTSSVFFLSLCVERNIVLSPGGCHPSRFLSPSLWVNFLFPWDPHTLSVLPPHTHLTTEFPRDEPDGRAWIGSPTATARTARSHLQLSPGEDVPGRERLCGRKLGTSACPAPGDPGCLKGHVRRGKEGVLQTWPFPLRRFHARLARSASRDSSQHSGCSAAAGCHPSS